MDNIGQTIVAIIGGIISLAVLAIVLSNGANTVNVVRSFFGGISSLLGVAISPITGQNVALGGGTLQAGWNVGPGSTTGYGLSGYGGTVGTATSGFAVSLGGTAGSALNTGLAAGGAVGGLINSLTGSNGALNGLLGGGNQNYIDNTAWDGSSLASSSGSGGFIDNSGWDQ